MTNPNNVYLDAAKSKTKERVLESFKSLNGKQVDVLPDETPRKLHARWNTSEDYAAMSADLKIDIGAEIAAALTQEFHAEVTQTLFGKMRQIDPTVEIDYDNLKDGAYIIRDILRNLPDETVLVVSPFAFTVLTTMANLESELEPTLEEFGYENLKHAAAKLEGNKRLFVDQYARHDTPISICGPDWFDYTADEIVIANDPTTVASGRVEPNENGELVEVPTTEVVQTFETDVKLLVKSNLVINVRIINNPVRISY